MQRYFHLIRRLQPLLPLTLLTLTSAALWAMSAGAQTTQVLTVPALAVGAGGGSVNFISVQLERSQEDTGPTIVFNELGTPWSGSAVGDELKRGVRAAVRAAARALGEDERRWHVTVRNHSRARITDGSSASSVVAVALMATAQGLTLTNSVGLTGTVDVNGKIGPVGHLPQKLEAAAEAHMTSLLVPRGQMQTAEWDLLVLGHQRHLTVIEVDSLADAYDYMTGAR